MLDTLYHSALLRPSHHPVLAWSASPEDDAIYVPWGRPVQRHADQDSVLHKQIAVLTSHGEVEEGK